MDKILVMDDDESTLETIKQYLSDLNVQVFSASDGIKGVEMLEKLHPDLVITDFKMPGLSGIEVLKRSKEIENNIPVILISAFEDFNTTINAMQYGAYDFIEKPLEVDRFLIIVKRALESKRLSEHLFIAVSDSKSGFQLEKNLIGKTPVMKEIIKKIGKISATKVNVLVQGESGTGKELITKIIHYSGVTKDSPFVAVNCTALSESLLESELFGHEKGAFTGAVKTKKGKFELAGDGTIFLDEISEISPNLQVKLLRVLQEREFERVGGENTIPMRARIVAATNRNLEELVRQEKFREDLYYRLSVFRINLPPLRERREDIPELVLYFLKKINRELHKNVYKIPYEVMEQLVNNDWVGNVRELENTLLEAVVLSKSEILEKENILIRKINQPQNAKVCYDPNMTLEQVERAHILNVLDSVSWNMKAAYTSLGICKATLYNKMQQYKIEREMKQNLLSV